MRHFLRPAAYWLILLSSCDSPAPPAAPVPWLGPPAPAARSYPGIQTNNNGAVLLDGLAPGLCCQLVSLRLYFDRYLQGYDEEGYVKLFYQPAPDSAWREVPDVGGPEIHLDTANLDRQGQPELLLTQTYRRGGSGGSGRVETLRILQMDGPEPIELFRTVVSCGDASSSGMHPGPWSNVQVSQAITAGYGSLRVGPVVRTCEGTDTPRNCRCAGYDPELVTEVPAAELAAPSTPPDLQPGTYTLRQGKLVRLL